MIAILSLIIFSFFLSSCDSPIDVQANREIVDLRMDGTPLFKISPDFVDFEYVLYCKKIEFGIRVENLSTKKIKLSDIIFKGSSNFYSLSKQKTIELVPGATDSVRFSMFPDKFGDFTDTIYFREYYKPFVVMHCTVPYVFISDVDFSSTAIGAHKLRTIDIYNFSETDIQITDYTIIGDTETIKIEGFNPKISPLTIPKGGAPRQIIVSFRPDGKKSYQASIIFEIQSQNLVLVDNVAKISGVGI